MEAMPSPPPPPQHHQALAPSHHNPDLLPLPEQQLYDRLFQEAGALDLKGFVHGRPAVELMSRSGLPKHALRQIWALCDPEGRGVLYRPHFHLAMRLMALTQNGYITPGDATLVGRIRAKDPLSVTLPQLPPLHMAPAPSAASPSAIALESMAVGMQSPPRPSMPTPTLSSTPAAAIATLPREVVAPMTHLPQPSFEAGFQTKSTLALPVPVMTVVPSMPTSTRDPAVIASGGSDIVSRTAALDAVVEDHEWDDFQEADPGGTPPPDLDPASNPAVANSVRVASASGLALQPYFVPSTPLPSSSSLSPASPSLPIPSMGLERAWVTASIPAHVNLSKTSMVPSLLDRDVDLSVRTSSSLVQLSSAQAPVMSSFTSKLPSSPHDPFGGAQLVSTSARPPLDKALSMASPFQVHEHVVAGAASLSSFPTSSFNVAHKATDAPSITSSLSLPLFTGGLTSMFVTTTSRNTITTTATTTSSSSSNNRVMEAHVSHGEEEEWDEFQGGCNGWGKIESSAKLVHVLPQKQTEGDDGADPFSGLNGYVKEQAVSPLSVDGDKRPPPSPIQLEESPPASSCSKIMRPSSPPSPISFSIAKNEEKKDTECIVSGLMSQIAAVPAPTVPGIAVASNPSWAQPNPWQDPNPWAGIPIHTPTMRTVGGGSPLTDGLEAVTTALPHFLPSSYHASPDASSSTSILLSPMARFAVKGEQIDEREVDKSSQSQVIDNSISSSSTAITTTRGTTSSSTQLSLENLLQKLWDMEMLNDAAALTGHMEAVATLSQARARYERAKADDELEEAIRLRVKVKELEDNICDEAKLQTWRDAIAIGDDEKREEGERGVVMLTLAQLQARVAAVDVGRGDAFEAAFRRGYPSLANQAASGAEGRREAVRRARRARRCCALLEGMDAGGALIAYPDHWLSILAVAKSQVIQAVESCKHVLLATETAKAGVRKEVVTSMTILSLVEAALNMVRVARLVLASAADALLGLVLAEKEGLEASVEELQVVLGHMGLRKHFASHLPPTSEAMGLLLADCAEAGSMKIDSRQVCALSLVPLTCSQHLGMSVTYFSGHAYFCACINLWLNAVSREAPQPQVQGKGGGGEGGDAFF
ncbi:actin cytoskeleton-regulatory complex protein pan1 [Nannochloropsis oceanica]